MRLNEVGSCALRRKFMDKAEIDSRSIEGDLRTAVAAGDLHVAFQPTVSAKSGKITGGETLARWTHPAKGPLTPNLFINAAEHCGLIEDLDKQILDMGCAEAMSWPDDVRVSVNVAPSQILPGRLSATVRAALKKSGLAPNRLQIEVTERLISQDVEGMFAHLQKVRDLGVQVVLDEYGAGTSSLNYFKRFRFDQIKIDKSFVDDIDSSHTDKAIVQAIIGIGREMGIEVVGKGVETEDQMRTLISLGCTHMQGFLFGRPCTPSSFRTRLATPLRTWMFATQAAGAA